MLAHIARARELGLSLQVLFRFDLLGFDCGRLRFRQPFGGVRVDCCDLRPLDRRILHPHIRFGDIERGPRFFNAGGEDGRIDLRNRLAGLYGVVEIDEHIRNAARELRADLDGQHRLDGAVGLHHGRDAAALNRRGEETAGGLLWLLE